MGTGEEPMRVGYYAGSFDPPTHGHLWMILEAGRLFDELHVWVAVNPAKKYRYSAKQRIDILRDMRPPGEVLYVIGDGFLVDHIQKNARADRENFLIRGIRNIADFELEKPMRHMNERMSGGKVQTVFLMPPKEYEDISSSVVNGLVGPAGWEKFVLPLVPPRTFKVIQEEWLKKNPPKPVGWQHDHKSLCAHCNYYSTDFKGPHQPFCPEGRAK
jgi:pantetheine-phosphate adenylyltransferase